MKNIILTIIVLASTSVFAGNEFKDINKASAKSMQKAVETFKAFDEHIGHNSDYNSGVMHLVQYQVREGGSLDKAIRNYIWLNNTGSYERPEEVETAVIQKIKLNNKFDHFFNDDLFNDVTGNIPKYEFDEARVSFKQAMLSMQKYNSIKFYYLGYGNEWGGCGGIVAADTYYKQFVAFQVCSYQD